MTAQNPANQTQFAETVKSTQSYRDYLARNYADAEGALNCVVLSDNTVIGLTGKHSSRFNKLLYEYSPLLPTNKNELTELQEKSFNQLLAEEGKTLADTDIIRVPEDNIWPFC